MKYSDQKKQRGHCTHIYSCWNLIRPHQLYVQNMHSTHSLDQQQYTCSLLKEIQNFSCRLILWRHSEEQRHERLLAKGWRVNELFRTFCQQTRSLSVSLCSWQWLQHFHLQLGTLLDKLNKVSMLCCQKQCSHMQRECTGIHHSGAHQVMLLLGVNFRSHSPIRNILFIGVIGCILTDWQDT